MELHLWLRFKSNAFAKRLVHTRMFLTPKISCLHASMQVLFDFNTKPIMWPGCTFFALAFFFH